MRSCFESHCTWLLQNGFALQEEVMPADMEEAGSMLHLEPGVYFFLFLCDTRTENIKVVAMLGDEGVLADLEEAGSGPQLDPGASFRTREFLVLAFCCAKSVDRTSPDCATGSWCDFELRPGSANPQWGMPPLMMQLLLADNTTTPSSQLIVGVTKGQWISSNAGVASEVEAGSSAAASLLGGAMLRELVTLHDRCNDCCIVAAFAHCLEAALDMAGKQLQMPTPLLESLASAASLQAVCQTRCPL